MAIGLLALQGDFREHSAMLRRLGLEPLEVRLPRHLAAVSHLIIPGGESTTIGRLLTMYGMVEPLCARAGHDLAIWGTCAGAILLARELLDAKRGGQPSLGLMNVTVRRNAFGSQLDSFEAPVNAPDLGAEPLPGIFIRAPRFENLGPKVQPLATLADGEIVAVRQGRLLATSFHPELTNDERMHRYFLAL
ncbi:MAG: pyridoxal 5'-phosphate synthase glutaminase subunit PdxT [Candidatus Viridilinea halotolerans]|uniref:Pyridoxal 5'-phosphate synthase subunit PdxT n=1 Tax=Candidatus Viridilinea halotolerans TaxID=2491704 RepID=A0A426TZX0_9CHLR|nr:MAG: pyridoxal 5'-phosphate synthase glutaminase subunit PdxT [Candidatus Viridilinea halotolerans]